MADDVDARAERARWDLFWLPSWARAVDRPELLYTCADRDGPSLHEVLRVRADDAALDPLVAEVDAAHRGRASRWLLARDSQRSGLPERLAAERGCGCVALFAREDTSDPSVARLGSQRHGTPEPGDHGPTA